MVPDQVGRLPPPPAGQMSMLSTPAPWKDQTGRSLEEDPAPRPSQLDVVYHDQQV